MKVDELSISKLNQQLVVPQSHQGIEPCPRRHKSLQLS